MYPSRTGTGNLCLMPGAEGREDHALSNHGLSLQEIVVKWVKGSDLWGDNRNVRELQADTKCLAPGRKSRTPRHFPEDRFGTSPVLQDTGDSWASPSVCAPHIPEQAAQTDRDDTRKMSVWKNALTSSQKDQQNIHASVTHDASTISHIPVKTPTTMQSWEMGNPKVCFDLWIPHKDNLTILTLPQLYLL